MILARRRRGHVVARAACAGRHACGPVSARGRRVFLHGVQPVSGGRVSRALAPFRACVSMDSLALGGPRAVQRVRCAAADRLGVSVATRSGAEREVRRWIRLQPSRRCRWHTLPTFSATRADTGSVEALLTEAALDPGLGSERSDAGAACRCSPASSRMRTACCAPDHDGECRRRARRALVPHHELPLSGEAARSARYRRRSIVR